MKTKQVEISYHKILDELPRNRFVDCYVNNNLSALIISGFPQQEELEETWKIIRADYTERIGSHEYKMYVSMYRQINQLKITRTQINFLAARENKEKGIDAGVLRVCYDEFFEKELATLLKTTLNLNWKDQKSYHDQLDKCMNRSRVLNIQIDLKLINFDAIEKKHKKKGTVKVDLEYFDKYLVTLSDFAGYNLPEDIKMGQYCIRLKKYTKACEDSNNKR